MPSTSTRDDHRAGRITHSPHDTAGAHSGLREQRTRGSHQRQEENGEDQRNCPITGASKLGAIPSVISNCARRRAGADLQVCVFPAGYRPTRSQT